eukprot:66564_1
MAITKGTTLKDVPAVPFIKTYAEHLKKSAKIVPPEWADICKTATHKELPPQDPDWFYTRAASLARKVYIRGQIGVGALAKVYGSRSRKGDGRKHFRKGARGLNRNIMIQLEKAKILKKGNNGGRRMTNSGQRELDTIAAQVVYNIPRIFALAGTAPVAEPLEEVDDMMAEEYEVDEGAAAGWGGDESE